MRIGVDSRPLREKQTSGIPMYVRTLLKKLAQIDFQNEYVLYAHKDFDFELPNKNWTKRSGAKTRYGSVWMQAELPLWIKEDKIDVFWGTQHILPLLMPKQVKAVLTVHDLVHYTFPKTMKLKNFIINKYIIPPSIRRTDAIVADTQWTLSDVKRFLNPQGKIMDVAHLGVSPFFYPRGVLPSRAKVKEMFNVSDPFLLTVGTFEPRKNIAGLIKAFSLITDKIPHHLAVVGQKGWKNQAVIDQISKSNIRDRIHLLGYVSDEMLPYLYSAADIFIFPSLYEGFGLPPLEAMACSAPVVCSNVSSIPEIVGDAAYLVNPHSPESIADGILKVVTDANLRSDLMDKGLRRASQFSWDKTAQQMKDLFDATYTQAPHHV